MNYKAASWSLAVTHAFVFQQPFSAGFHIKWEMMFLLWIGVGADRLKSVADNSYPEALLETAFLIHTHQGTCSFSKLRGSPADNTAIFFLLFHPNSHTPCPCLKLAPENETNNSFWTAPSSRKCLSLGAIIFQAAI